MEITKGETLEWAPAALSDGVAFIGADAKAPPAVEVLTAAGRRTLAGQAPGAEFPGAKFVVPRWWSPSP